MNNPEVTTREVVRHMFTEKLCKDFEQAVHTRMIILGMSMRAIEIIDESLKGIFASMSLHDDAEVAIYEVIDNMIWWMNATKEDIEHYFGS